MGPCVHERERERERERGRERGRERVGESERVRGRERSVLTILIKLRLRQYVQPQLQ